MRSWSRHALTALAAMLMTLVFAALRTGLHPVHQWNRALADAAALLLVGAIGIGPLARVWAGSGRALNWRRELGIWSFLLALGHVIVYASSVYAWDVRGFVQRIEAGHTGWDRSTFAAANWVGVAALAYALLPAVTSNDRSLRLLGAGWKRIQSQSHLFYALSLLHMFLFALLVYGSQGAQIAWVVFWTALLAVSMLQVVAFGVTLHRRRSRTAARGSKARR